jgi:hypothetical protein
MPVKLPLWSDLTGPAFTMRIMVINSQNAIALNFFLKPCGGGHTMAKISCLPTMKGIAGPLSGPVQTLNSLFAQDLLGNFAGSDTFQLFCGKPDVAGYLVVGNLIAQEDLQVCLT